MALRKIIRFESRQHAVGEVVLIVINVSLALMVNSWYVNVQERRIALLSLKQLKTAIEADLAEYLTWHQKLHQSEEALLTLHNALETENYT